MLEETSAAVASAIEEGQLAKRALLDDLMEAERQIMLAERKIQLEKEMQVGYIPQWINSVCLPASLFADTEAFYILVLKQDTPERY